MRMKIVESNKEKTILEISTTSGYDPQIIELIYDFTNGDKEGIEKILTSIHKNILIVKVNFESKNIDKRGFLYFVYDSSNYQIIEKEFFATKRFINLNLRAPWEDLREKILAIKLEEEYDRKMWGFYDRELLKENFTKELKRICMDFLNKGKKFKPILETLLSKALAPVFYNKNFSMELEIELVDPFIFFKPLESKNKNEENDDDFEIKKNDDEMIVQLKVYPILDPVNGKIIKHISPEDKILFEVKDERETAHYIAELLEKKSDAGLIGSSQSYSILDQDTLKLKIFFAPGIWGESIVPNTIRVKTINILEEDTIENIAKTNKFIKIPYKPFIIGIIIVMFIVLFILVFYIN